MKKYTITIEETISQEFDIMANNAEQARAIAIEIYNLGELVLKTAFVNAVGVALKNFQNHIVLMLVLKNFAHRFC